MNDLAYSILFFWVLAVIPAYSQSPESDVQEILQRLDAGEPVENMVMNLGDINFRFGTADLEPQATTYLNQVVNLMQKASNIELYIQGFADNVGSSDFNKRLSTNRAQNVLIYLEKKGVESDRLISEGFGSGKPVADNTTSEGRAQNRRVEMEVIKPEAVETIQDIIVLTSRQRIGSVVIDYNEEQVRYQQFTSNDTMVVQTEEVDTIYFSDGTVKAFPRPVKEKFDFAQWWGDNVPIFKTSESFHRGNFIVGLGIGLDNVDIGYGDSEHPIVIPPVMLIVELPIGYNVGLGMTAGAMHWGVPEVDDILYEYYAVSARLAYHFNLGRKVDLYIGGAITGRQITKTEGDERNSKQEIDPGLLLGIRYYINNTFGVFGEIGDESVAYPKVGLAIKFGN
ncbi:OmpA family protein [Tunicatimonas pelagia]|uniref:OmpA family protein n=1 Tax=Tunicatimonas pelagia TaxID=931531 RepID=UPI002664E501|nr:OmpA family protein [Tunicatimonas pelagia]WKN45263.1 OmpA family protein [Tunicatimonas pelagia]